MGIFHFVRFVQKKVKTGIDGGGRLDTMVLSGWCVGRWAWILGRALLRAKSSEIAPLLCDARNRRVAMPLIPATSQPISVKYSMTPVPFAGVAKPLTFTVYYLSPGPGVATIAAFKAAFDAAVAASFAAAHTVKSLAPTLVITDMTVYTNAPVTFLPAVNAAYVGTLKDDALPPAQNALFVKNTGLKGKDNRGALRLPMVPELGTTDQDLTVAQQALYATLMAALFGNITAGGFVFTPQLYQPSSSNLALGRAGISMQLITAIAAAKTVSGLKTRKQKNVY